MNVVLKHTDFYLKARHYLGKAVMILPMFGLRYLIPTETAMFCFQHDLTVEQTKHIKYSGVNGIFFP